MPSKQTGIEFSSIHTFFTNPYAFEVLTTESTFKIDFYFNFGKLKQNHIPTTSSENFLIVSWCWLTRKTRCLVDLIAVHEGLNQDVGPGIYQYFSRSNNLSFLKVTRYPISISVSPAFAVKLHALVQWCSDFKVRL